jgi:hypothetical protein
MPTSRPSLDHMWLLFQDVAPGPDRSLPNGAIANLRKVGDRIGGHVKINIDQGIKDISDYVIENPGQFPVSPKGFTNACSIRLSYVLNRSGVHISRSTLWETVTGGDHANYIYRLAGIRAFLSHTFGRPDIHKGLGAQKSDFSGKQGIIVFDLNFSDASGHATLWSGDDAADEDYFTPDVPGLVLRGVKLWICP